jgi:hypothetical protein
LITTNHRPRMHLPLDGHHETADLWIHSTEYGRVSQLKLPELDRYSVMADKDLTNKYEHQICWVTGIRAALVGKVYRWIGNQASQKELCNSSKTRQVEDFFGESFKVFSGLNYQGWRIIQFKVKDRYHRSGTTCTVKVVFSLLT